MRKSKVLSNTEFWARVREYLPMGSVIRESDSEGKPVGEILTGDPLENTFYFFDGEAVQAISMAIEETALEEASGHCVTAIQDFSQFGELKEHYWQLGATLENVQVIAAGKKPSRNGHVKFCVSKNFALKKFWLILYKGSHKQIMLLCQQVNQAAKFEEKEFLGFFTFEPALVEETARNVIALAGKKDGVLDSFERFRQIDAAAKRLKAEFTREQQTLETALNKLKKGSRNYRAEDFRHDLDKTLQRLGQLTVCLPETTAGIK